MKNRLLKKKFKDITGKRYNSLVALKFSERDYLTKVTYWLFECDCGKTIVKSMYNVISGETKSCGCGAMKSWKKNLFIHGLSGTAEFKIWKDIKSRCDNPKCRAFKNYGGRGISCCERWSSFLPFLSDMGKRPHKYTLERIDNNGDYCPENCKWAPYYEQARNRRNNRNILFCGVSMVQHDWAKLLTIRHDKIRQLLNKGWSFEKIFSTYHERSADFKVALDEWMDK